MLSGEMPILTVGAVPCVLDLLGVLDMLGVLAVVEPSPSPQLFSTAIAREAAESLLTCRISPP